MAKTSTPLSPQQVLTQLKAGQYQPLYFLMGEETYYTHLIGKYIATHALSPEEQAFNQLILYGTDVDGGAVLEHAKSYPMMGARQVVIVREAQKMKDLDKLVHYLPHMMPSTVLVFCYMGKSLDKRTQLYKTLDKTPGVVMLDVPVLREDKVPQWIDSYLREAGYTIEPEASMILADYLGTDLNRITMELDKLFTLLPEARKTIDAQVIESAVGISREYNPFTLCKYLSEGKFAKAQQIAQFMSQNVKTYAFPMLTAVLHTHFYRLLKYQCFLQENPGAPAAEVARAVGMNPYFLSEMSTAARRFPMRSSHRVLGLIRAYDGKFKSNERGAASEGELLIELICRIFLCAKKV